MNRRAMIKPLVTAIAAALVLSACQQAAAPPAQLNGTDIQGASFGGAFTLTGEDGQRYSWDDFKGKYRMIYFGYAFCPDACPTDVAVMMRGFQQFEKQHPAKAAKVQPLFATIDPTRDTQQVVKEFTDSFHPRLLGLTGTQAEVDTAAKAFRVYAARGKDLGNGAYLMDHSRFAYLMDPDGKPLVILAVDKSAEAVAADLAVMVR
ncbi:MAG: SCO family protein [Novosphingobium sp.]|jgi:protein SCO1/2